MAATLTFPTAKRAVNGNRMVARGTLVPDTSYPTGGYAVTAAQLGLRFIEDVVLYVNSATKFAGWDSANSKVQIYIDGGIPAEAGNGTDQSALTINVLAIGY